MYTSSRFLKRVFFACVLATSALLSTAAAQWNADATLPDDQTVKLLDNIAWKVALSPTAGATPAAFYLAYVTGRDVYGNPTYIQVGRGQVPAMGPDDSFDIEPGDWTVPNDGTLFNVIGGGYQFIVALYPAAGVPTTLAQLNTPLLAVSGRFFIDVIPNLALASPTPEDGTDTPGVGVEYPAGIYRGGDIVQFSVTYQNGRSGEPGTGGRKQSRPMRPGRDRFALAIGLSSNAEFNKAAYLTTPDDEDFDGPRPDPDPDAGSAPATTVNDDFKLMNVLFSGDSGAPPAIGPVLAEFSPVPDGFSQVRKVEVVGSGLAPIPPHGIFGITDPLVPGSNPTQRNYTPQPYDGFLDIGETVTVYTEQLMPDNWIGRYFVVAGALMVNELLDAGQANNIFVSNSANKIELLERGAPLLQPVSAITSQTGSYQEGGNGPSDFGTVSEDGNFIAFASEASNLILPDPLNPGAPQPGNPAAVVPGSNPVQQVFIRYRQSYETQLASRSRTGAPANADAFNPAISANGLYVAYDSVADNIDPVLNTGARSSIYVFNRDTEETVVVSKSSSGQLADGNSYNPSISASGRFVVFESAATNLDPSRVVQPNSGRTQIYLHDRDVDQDGVFDEPGAVATYLVSINERNLIANGLCFQPVVNLNDSPADVLANGGMYVAFTSYADNMPLYGSRDAGNMIYRVRVNVLGAARGPVPSSVVPVTLNNAGARTTASGTDLVGATIKPDSFEPAINGDGSVVAFSSSATNLVPGDSNRVSDVFVRDFKRPINQRTERVSISGDRAATGTITLQAYAAPGNLPAYRPNIGDNVTISDGRNTVTFFFGIDVPIGANVAESCRNLADRINASILEIQATVTTPPNVGINAPNFRGYWAGINLLNISPLDQVEGAQQNVPMTAVSTSLLGTILVDGMRSGGRQADDDALLPGQPDFPPTQGVAYGSWQPTLDRSGRLVAFRAVATTLDVFRPTPENNVKTLPPFQSPSPREGELVRPLIFPTSNVYLHDREARFSQRVSVSNFGYPTYVAGNQQSGRGANTSANNSAPALSADGRFVVFSTDSEGAGGLVFDGNNLTPRDNTRFRDVMVQDRLINGAAPVQPDTAPRLTLVSPAEGTAFTTGTTVVISADAAAARNKRIARVEFQVNDTTIASLTAAPYRTSQVFTSPGAYSVTAIATDNFGVQTTRSVRITVRAPVGQPPTVGITHPSDQPAPAPDTGSNNNGSTVPAPSVARFSTASTFYVNALLIPGFGATIDDSKVRFLANGEPITGTISKLGNQYGILWRPAANATYEIVAEGTDSNNNTVVSAPLPIEIAPVARPLPTVAMTRSFAAGAPRVGSTLQVEAAYQSNSAVGVTRVDFYANSVFIGSFTPGGASAALSGTASVQWAPESEGSYTLTARVVQINQAVGSHSITAGNSLSQQIQPALPLPPGKTAPIVLLTDPISEPRMVLGSEVYINVNATDPDDARGIATDKVSILINGEAQTGVRRYGDTWSIRWKPAEIGTFTIQAVAEDREGYTAVMPSFPIFVLRGLRPLPKIEILPLTTANSLNTSSIYPLEARVFFPQGTAVQPRIDFYGNGVLLGSGFQAVPPGTDGYATYRFDWKPASTTGADSGTLRISAKAVSINFSTQVGQADTQVVNVVNNFGSAISAELDPVTVAGVTSNTPNESFVVDLYNKIFYRAPNYGEWKYYVDRLNSNALSQSQVIMEVMGYDPALTKFNYRNLYGQTSGMALAAYYRLKLSPSSPLIQDFINQSLGDTTLLPITVYPAPGLAAPPYGATVGMGRAFQEIIDSAAFNRSYRLVRGYSNQRFVVWMRDTLFRGRPTGQLVLLSGTGGGSTLPPTTSGNTATGRPGQTTGSVNSGETGANGSTNGGSTGGGTGSTGGGSTSGLMENPAVAGFPQGAAMAFLSRLVVASYSDTEKVFQRQMATTALNFQLSGGRVWDPNLYRKPGYGLFSEAVVKKILSQYPVGTTAASALQARNRQLAGMAGTYRGNVAAGEINSLAGGELELTANGSGVVTGVLTMNGRAYAFRGAVNQDGKIAAVAQGVPGERSYLLDLAFLEPGTTRARVTGTVASGQHKVGVTATVEDNQAVRNARKVTTMEGRYEGIVHRAALNGQTGGTIRINSNAKGAVTGQVRLNGRALAFRGNIAANGRIVARTDAVKGLPRYDLALQVLQPGSASAAHVTGTLSTGKQKATVRAHISPWSVHKSAALYSGKFNVVMNPAPAGRKPAASVPKGPRIAELTIRNDGTVVLKGQLGTGVPLTWTGRLTGDGRVLLHSPVKANGSVVGTVAVNNRGGRKTVNGVLDWTKPPAGKDKGFKLNLAVARR